MQISIFKFFKDLTILKKISCTNIFVTNVIIL